MSIDYNAVGHILIVGGTYSGKSTFTRYLISKYVEKGHADVYGKLYKYEEEDVYVFTASPNDWENYNVYQEWDEVSDVFNEISAKKKGLLILDDFNQEINTVNDKKLLTYFERGRHHGMRVLITTHNPNSVGPKVRNNILYTIIMKTLI